MLKQGTNPCCVTVLNRSLSTREDGQAHTPEISSRRAKGLTVSRDEHSPPREPRAYSHANNGLSCPNFRANPFSELLAPVVYLAGPSDFRLGIPPVGSYPTLSPITCATANRGHRLVCSLLHLT
jgi:hypothetical protein